MEASHERKAVTNIIHLQIIIIIKWKTSYQKVITLYQTLSAHYLSMCIYTISKVHCKSSCQSFINQYIFLYLQKYICQYNYKQGLFIMFGIKAWTILVHFIWYQSFVFELVLGHTILVDTWSKFRCLVNIFVGFWQPPNIWSFSEFSGHWPQIGPWPS